MHCTAGISKQLNITEEGGGICLKKLKSKYKLESNGRVAIYGDQVFEVTICHEKEMKKEDLISK